MRVVESDDLLRPRVMRDGYELRGAAERWTMSTERYIDVPAFGHIRCHDYDPIGLSWVCCKCDKLNCCIVLDDKPGTVENRTCVQCKHVRCDGEQLAS